MRGKEYNYRRLKLYSVSSIKFSIKVVERFSVYNIVIGNKRKRKDSFTCDKSSGEVNSNGSIFYQDNEEFALEDDWN